jgi:hypothetical protein
MFLIFFCITDFSSNILLELSLGWQLLSNSNEFLGFKIHLSNIFSRVTVVTVIFLSNELLLCALFRVLLVTLKLTKKQ